MSKDNELISWSSKFACGIKLIDEQHMGLVTLVNDMFNHVTGDEKQENEYFNKIIKRTIEYVRIHFATEEKIMLATNFEGYSKHKKKHDTFVLAIIGNIRAYQFSKRFSLYTFTKYLKEWILTHIALMDKQYFEHIKNIATRKANGKLSITKSDIKASVVVR